MWVVFAIFALFVVSVFVVPFKLFQDEKGLLFKYQRLAQGMDAGKLEKQLYAFRGPRIRPDDVFQQHFYDGGSHFSFPDVLLRHRLCGDEVRV